MKIYSKRHFAAGLFSLAAFLVAALNIVEGSWTYKLFIFALAVKCLYTGLSKSGSRRAKHINAHYKETARMLHGKYYALKDNLLLIVLAGFIVVGLVLKALDIWMPKWLIAVFVMAMLVTVFYSVGLHRDVTDYIDEHIPQEDEPEP